MTQFDAISFLHLAQELSEAKTEEAKLRTAISRAYYAVFLLARDKAGVSVKHNVHAHVIISVRRHKGRAVADELAKLKRLRTVADYEVIPVRASDRNWRLNWTKARHLVNRILPKIQAW